MKLDLHARDLRICHVRTDGEHPEPLDGWDPPVPRLGRDRGEPPPAEAMRTRPFQNLRAAQADLQDAAARYCLAHPVDVGSVFVAELRAGSLRLPLVQCTLTARTDGQPRFLEGVQGGTTALLPSELRMWLWFSSADTPSEILVRPYPDRPDSEQWLPFDGGLDDCRGRIADSLGRTWIGAGDAPAGARLRCELALYRTDGAVDAERYLGSVEVADLRWDAARQAFDDVARVEGACLLAPVWDVGDGSARAWEVADEPHARLAELTRSDPHVEDATRSAEYYLLYWNAAAPVLLTTRAHAHPAEPPCTEQSRHAWQMPDADALGTGVFLHARNDGGDGDLVKVTLQECCAHCGQFRHTISLTRNGMPQSEPSQVYARSSLASRQWVQEMRGPGLSEAPVAGGAL